MKMPALTRMRAPRGRKYFFMITSFLVMTVEETKSCNKKL